MRVTSVTIWLLEEVDAFTDDFLGARLIMNNNPNDSVLANQPGEYKKFVQEALSEVMTAYSSYCSQVPDTAVDFTEWLSTKLEGAKAIRCFNQLLKRVYKELIKRLRGIFQATKETENFKVTTTVSESWIATITYEEKANETHTSGF